MASQNMPDGAVVGRIEYPNGGHHVVRVHLEPLVTEKIQPFIDWALARLEGLISHTNGCGEIMPSGTVVITFFRQKYDAVSAPLLRQVDKETFSKVLQPRYTSELVASAFVTRGPDERHRGTVIDLSHVDGEPFDPQLVKEIRQLECIQGATLDNKTCRVTMANPPALNDEDGRITELIGQVAKVLGAKYEKRQLPIEDNPHLALLREFDYRPSEPPKKSRKTSGS